MPGIKTLIDSHCHLHMLDLVPYEGSLERLLQKTRAEGVGTILNVGTSLDDREIVLQMAKQYEDVYATVGIHPHERLEVEPSETQLIEWANPSKVIGIGECGLDYYYHEDGNHYQPERFRRHIRAARAVKKPLIIHSRGAPHDTIRIMKEENAEEACGIMHCFTESWAVAEQALALGFYISISGIVTFKKADNVQEVAAKVPLDRLLIETDAPYLAPQPMRGKKNEPAFLKYTAAFIAELRQIDVSLLIEKTSGNFNRLFGL